MRAQAGWALASATGERYDSQVISTFRTSWAAGRVTVRLCAVAAWLMLALLPLRAEPVSVGFEAARINLLPRVEKVEEISSEATVELAATGDAPPQKVALNARGAGPRYRWAVFTLHNPEPYPRDMVIAAPHQRFVGSRILRPLPEGSRAIALSTSDGRAVPPLPSLGTDAFAITLAPGATASYALEVSRTGLDSLSLWHRGAFHVVADRYAFFRGLVLGISILLGISFACLFIVRLQAIFPAAALFGWSAIAFLVIEMGYLPVVLAKLPTLPASEQSLRALAEGLMLAGVVAMLASFLELRRWMPRVFMALMAAGAVAIALALYGLVDPRTAIGLIRIAFGLVVAAGSVVMVVLWRRGAARAQAALLGWLVLAGWTVVAGIGAYGLLDPAVMHPLVSAGLVLVLLTVAFTLAQLAFGLGTLSGAASEEAGRRALALAASDQAVWDRQVDQGRFYVGPEIERALGLDEGTCDDAAGWLHLIHPADRVAYGAAVEAAERRGRGSFSQEFRLRRADGSYRWYQLRARAVPGGNDGASRLIGTLADVTALRRSEDRLLADAVRDRLTGLPNRALFLDRLEQAMGQGREWPDPQIYVIALDLDRFKSFNDGLGVEAGDYLLNTTGRRLQACIGPADTVARLPGHQFGIIWNAGRHAFGITELTQALSAAVTEPIQLPAGEVVLTASMGVAPVSHGYRGAEAVLRNAEIALYEAKRQGYGAIAFFQTDMHDERSELLQLEQNLRHALERNEIEVVYQPIIRLADRKLAGFEALMRWRRGDVVLEPDSFMGLAEETGIIRDLGRHMLTEASRRLGSWQRAFRPHDPLFVAVNISSVQLLNNDLVEDIQRLLEREDLQPGSLKLELTESLVVENPELARKLLMRLKHMGVALACDDFGTGYSGLESVLRLPFDTVKLDRVFLEAENGERSWKMVEAMLRLSRDLGLDVVAEGIETDEQMERLSHLGCDFGQGYFIGLPVTASQVVEALGGRSTQDPGTGLAAFWSRLTGTRPAAVDTPVAGSHPPSEVTMSVPEPVEEPDLAEDDDAAPVIDVRTIMPVASKPPPEPSPASAVPEVGAAPFAPRRLKRPEVELPEVTFAELMLPRVEPPAATPPEPVQTVNAPAREPEPSVAERVHIATLKGDAGAAQPAAPANGSAAAPSGAKRPKRTKRKADQPAGTDARKGKGRRGEKAALAKRAPAGKAPTRKSAAPKAPPSKAPPSKPAPSKAAPARKAAAKCAPAKKAPAKKAPAKKAAAKAEAAAKPAPAKRAPAKREKPSSPHRAKGKAGSGG